MQSGDITINLMVEVDFTSPELSATNIVMWKFIWMTPQRADKI